MLTSASSILLLSVDGLGIKSYRIKGFEADDMFAIDNQVMTESRMGVDGGMGTGFVYTPTAMTISLMPSIEGNKPNDSIKFFNDWIAAMRSNVEAFNCYGEITIKTTGQKFELINGALEDVTRVPAHKKTLQGQTFKILWQEVRPSSL